MKNLITIIKNNFYEDVVSLARHNNIMNQSMQYRVTEPDNARDPAHTGQYFALLFLKDIMYVYLPIFCGWYLSLSHPHRIWVKCHLLFHFTLILGTALSTCTATYPRYEVILYLKTKRVYLVVRTVDISF